MIFGSFDPITFGHLDLIDRSLSTGICDDLIIMVRRKRGKQHLISRRNACDLVRQAVGARWTSRISFRTSSLPFIEVPRRVDMCIRGVRDAADETYERRVRRNVIVGSLISLRLPVGLTLLAADPALEGVSSTAAREALAVPERDFGALAQLVPGAVAEALLRARAIAGYPFDARTSEAFNTALAHDLAH